MVSPTNNHAVFVSTFTGCSQEELFIIQIIVFLSLMLRNVSIPWIFLGRRFNTSFANYWFKFLIDFLFLAIPGLLAMTVLSKTLSLVSVILSACLVTLLIFVVCEYHMSPDRPTARVVLNKIIDEHHHPTTFLTYYRSTMLILVSAAILAVDFPVFPRRFAKTEEYGHSLMDVGVAGFVFASAMGRQLKRTTIQSDKSNNRSMWSFCFNSSYIILPTIGLFRTIILTSLNYPQHVTEYGVHWNFFYTITIIKVSANVFPKRFPILLGILFCIMQQALLTNGYEEWIISGRNNRETLFSANAEGICSMMGYLALYYISDSVAEFISKTGIRIKSWLECCVRLFCLAIIFFVFQLIAERTIGPPCRRVVNVTYIFAQMSLLIFSLACFLCVQLFSIVAWAANVPHFSADENPWYGVEPCLSSSVNRFGLAFFLLSNFFTGLVNISIDTHTTNDITAMFILIGYLLVICTAVHYRGCLKLKNMM